VRAKTSKKLAKTQFLMVLSSDISVLRKFCFKNMQKIPFGEGQVQDPIPVVPGKFFAGGFFVGTFFVGKFFTGELFDSNFFFG
jgi:hypothetical protein